MPITLATRTATKVLSWPTVVAIFGGQLTAMGTLTHRTPQATTGLCKTSLTTPSLRSPSDILFSLAYLTYPLLPPQCVVGNL